MGVAVMSTSGLHFGKMRNYYIPENYNVYNLETVDKKKENGSILSNLVHFRQVKLIDKQSTWEDLSKCDEKGKAKTKTGMQSNDVLI